jgi:hypothetical protein
MMRARSGVLVFVVAVSGASAMVEPGLPVWEEGERAGLEASGWVAGGLLLSDDPIPEEPKEEEPVPLVVEEPEAGEIAENEVPPDEIPEQYWPAYFAERPKSFLVDPQGLLSQVDYRDRLGFLNYHAGDSSIDLYVYVFKGEQDIPGEVREEEIVERFFSEGRPAAVVYYYMGAPQRSVMYLSPSLTDAVSAAEQRRALESSVMQAFKDVDPASQIEGFLVQMSIRIYWMERMLGGGEGQIEEGPVVAKAVKSTGRKSSFAASLEPYIEPAKRYATLAGFMAGIAAVALGMGAWMKRRARYRFPDFEVEPRLGGAHAAGVGAVISFASSAVPPASQRDQVPDYLRRA